MGRSNTFAADTVLYHTGTGEKRMFPKGESDPGDIWSETKGGEKPGAKTNVQALEDLISAQGQIENLQGALATQDASMAEVAAARDAALATVAGLEQRAIDAEKARAEAESLLTDAAKARDVAAEAAQNARERITELETDIANAITARDEAHEMAESYAKDAQAAKDALAAFDKDGDGKPGGKAKKSADTTPAPADA